MLNIYSKIFSFKRILKLPIYTLKDKYFYIKTDSEMNEYIKSFPESADRSRFED